MTDLIAANDRCTCMEVHGEDPNCSLHGIATAWALENTLPSEWQTCAIEAADQLSALRERVEALEGALSDTQSTLSAVKAEAIVDGGGTCIWIAEALNQQMRDNAAILAQHGGEDVIANIAADIAAGRTESQRDG